MDQSVITNFTPEDGESAYSESVQMEDWKEVCAKACDNEPTAWPARRKYLKDALVVPVMGKTGAGKSTFIKRLGAEAELLTRAGGSRVPVVGNDTESETQDIYEYVLYRGSQKIIFYDTPGFSDADVSDTELLTNLAQFLSGLYRNNTNVAGLLWLYDINTKRFEQSSRRNLDYFKSITGSQNMNIVTLVLTMWDEAADEDVHAVFEERERQIKEKYWEDIINNGAKVLRNDCSTEDILDTILQNSSGTESLAIQTELVKERRTLADTGIGKLLIGDLGINSTEDRRERLLQQITEQEKRNKPVDLLRDELANADATLKRKRGQQAKLTEWTFEKKAPRWMYAPAGVIGSIYATVGGAAAFLDASTGLGALGSGLAFGTTLGVVSSLAVAGAGAALIGSVMAIQRFARSQKRDEPSDLDRKTKDALRRLSKKYPTDSLQNTAELLSKGTVVGHSSDRLLRPIQYAERLHGMEEEVLRQSSVPHCFITSRQALDNSKKVAAPEGDTGGDEKDQDEADALLLPFNGLKSREIFPSPDSKVLVPALPSSSNAFKKILGDLLSVQKSNLNHPRSNSLFHLSECLKVAQRILYNIIRLKEIGYVDDRISVIVADAQRPNVAHMQPIKLREIRSLVTEFADAAEQIAAGSAYDLSILTNSCRAMLGRQRLGLFLEENKTAEDTWRTAIHFLDACVIFYAGAHTSPFPKRYFGQAEVDVRIPGPYFVASSASYVFARRKLLCLEEFLGGCDVWVLHRGGERSEPRYDRQTAMMLAVDADTLADIWGPMSKEIIGLQGRPSGPTRSYRLGNGEILPWQVDEGVSLHRKEVYCHWVSDFAEIDLRPFEPKKLDGSEILLVGAALQMGVNTDCHKGENKSEVMKHDYETRGWLAGHPNSQALQFDLDTKQRQAQFGTGKYVTLMSALTHTYKRREGTGVFYKQDLLKAWMLGQGTPDPSELELLWGVEFSFCTRNARRVPLSSIIVSENMSRYFDFSSSKEFLLEVGHRRSEGRLLQNLWNERREWRDEICSAVSRCLKALIGTGQQHGGKRAFRALLCPKDVNVQHFQVTLPGQGWMNLFTDSFMSANFAVVTDDCLEVDWQSGRTCQAHVAGIQVHERPILQTALNVSNPPPKGLSRVGRGGWRLLRDSPPDCVFRVRGVGYLRIVGILKDGETVGFRTEWARRRNHLGSDLGRQVVDVTEASGETGIPSLRVFVEDS